MNRDHVIKVRLASVDVERLEYCSKATGNTKSEIVRRGIEIVTAEIKNEKENNGKMEKNLYIEETVREDIGYRHLMAMDRKMLREMLIHSGHGTESERTSVADAQLDTIDRGAEICIGSPYVCKYRIATPDEIEEASGTAAREEAEIDEMDCPETKTIIEALIK